MSAQTRVITAVLIGTILITSVKAQTDSIYSIIIGSLKNFTFPIIKLSTIKLSCIPLI